MEGMNKFAVVKYQDVQEPLSEIVPTLRIPKLTLPLNCFKEYKVCGTEADETSRTAIILFLCDTQVKTSVKIGRSRCQGPSQRLLEDASSLDEAEKETQCLLRVTNRRMNLVQETRKLNQEKLLEKVKQREISLSDA